MIVPYMRSSSMGSWDWCNHQYFLLYELGYSSSTNIKTEKGSIVHKILECLAIRKYREQQGIFDSYIEDEAIGKMPTSLLTPEVLTEKVFDYYAGQHTEMLWSLKDQRECLSWVYKVLNYHDGVFSPMKRTVVAPEQHFNIPLDKEWAKYTDENGNETQLAIKGTIDAIYEVDENIIEILDWKTGRRLNWATGKEKNFDALCKDNQLLLYYYAANKLYPDKHIMLTIFYINDGGPFSLAFSDKDLELTEKILQKYFKEMTQYSKPKLHVDWRCDKFCAFGAKGGVNAEGDTKCQEVRKYALKHGMKETVREFRKTGFDKTQYSDGGGQSAEARKNKQDIEKKE